MTSLLLWWISLPLLFIIPIITIYLLVLWKTKKSDIQLNKKQKAMFLILIMISLPMIGISSVKIFNYSSFNGNIAEIRTSNDVQYYYIECNSTRFDFGYLQGFTFHKEILNLRVILNPIAGYFAKENRDYIDDYKECIDDTYLEEMMGMVKGVRSASGILVSLDDIILQNIFIDIMYSKQIPLLHAGCSAIGFVNSSQDTIIGQNFDFTKIMGYKQLLDCIFFVHSKFNGTEIFGLRVGASLSIPMAKTKDLMVVTNVVKVLSYNDSVVEPLFVRSRKALELSSDIESFETNMNFASFPSSFNFIVGNSTHIRGYQVAPEMYVVNNSNLIVNTNTYLDTTMKELLYDANYSVPRQNKVTELSTVAIEDDYFAEDEMLDIFNYESPDDPTESIYRTGSGLLDTITICYITNNYFGFLNSEYSIGTIPI